MAAVTGGLYEAQRVRLEASDETAHDQLARLTKRSAAFAGLGAALRQLPTVPASHASLTRTVWVRRVLEQWASQQRFTVERGEEGTNAGQLVLRLSGPPMPKNVVPWMTAARDTKEFALWGESGKMACPTWDLPAGGLYVGGTCPGADAGQTVVPPQKRRAALQEQNGKFFLRHAPPGVEFAPEMVEGGTICSQCITGDALIMVRGRGLCRIDSMLGQEFEVWSGVDWRTTRVKPMGMKSTVEVALANGQRVRATGDHRFLTKEGWVEAAQLEEDRLPIQLPKSSPFPEWARVIIPALGEQYRTEKRGELPEFWSRELGVFLGYMVGDGSFSEARTYPTASLVAAAHDADDLRRLSSFVTKWTGSESEVVVRESEVSELVSKGAPHAHVAWRSKSLTHLLRSLGLKKEGSATRTPAEVWNADEAGVAGYLSGLFSTDGSIGTSAGHTEISFASTAQTLVDEVQQLLAAFGIRTSRCEYTSNRARGYLSLWKLSIKSVASVRRFAEVIGFFNERKQALLMKALENEKDVATRETTYRVESVVDTGKVEAVYDLLNVGPEAQFVVNGVTVHNCYAFEGNYPSPHVQLGEVLRYWWVRSMLEQRRAPELIETLVLSMRLIRYPETPYGILPVRIHSAGDFFSKEYAKVWLAVADELWRMGGNAARVRMWAPTRTWAQWGNEFWQDALGNLEAVKDGKPPNLMVRASAYNFNDEAPSAFHPSNAKGSTSLLQSQDEARLARNRAAGIATTDPRTYRPPETERRYDWACPTYSIEQEKHTCANATNPEGGIHCRACWVRPEWRVQYTAH